MCLDTAQAFEADIQTQFTVHLWEFRREVILALLLGKKFERSNVYICASDRASELDVVQLFQFCTEIRRANV